jgi:glycosyltransferase involved in cell wall biosynthesis
MTQEMGISDKVAFTGVKKNPFAYVSRSDLYVCSSNHEGFPNAVLEAMALKKPVISADCKTGPREILLSEKEYEALIREKPDGSSVEKAIDGQYGVLVPDMDQNVNMDKDVITEGERILAAEIIKMLNDEVRMKNYAEKAYERALFYAPDKYSDSIHEILKRFE